MQLINLVTLLSMAATTIAAPSVSVKRTDGGSTDACGQNQVLSCCTQGQSAVTPMQVLFNLMDSPNLLPIVAPFLNAINTEIQTGCTALVSTVTCTGQQACCVSNAGTGNTNTNTESGGLVNIPIASNDNVYVCAPVGSIPVVVPTTGN